MTDDGGKKGVQWRPVKLSGLSKESQNLHENYSAALAKAKDLADELKKELREEWDTKFPDGIDGKVCSFNVMGGKLQYAMTNKEKQKTKNINEDDGDDVFSDPQ